MMRYNKYDFYERSVQTPDQHAEQYEGMYREIKSRDARVLREDFCGTFRVSCEWIRRHSENQAIGLDLDPEPLTYGRKNHLPTLSPDQKRRLKILQQNVLSVTPTPADLIVAANFSFFIFKERKVLRNYFEYCRKSLNRDGIVILELSGGPGMIEPMQEKVPIYENKKRIFTYIWHQKKFDPITHDAEYAIHFKLPSGKRIENAFTYDWRLWTIPEVRELLLEAGFDDVVVYWETTHRGRGTGEYVITQNGDNAYAWIAYVIGIKKSHK